MENVAVAKEWLVSLPRMYIDWWLHVYDESPWHVAIETSLILFILWVVFFKRQYNPEQKGFGARDPEALTEKEKQALIDEWEPTPLVPESEQDDAALWDRRVTVTKVTSATEVLVEGDDRPKLNMATQDFLGLGVSEETKDVATEAMEEYTLGSCGPRGFYGSTKLHIDLENEIAKFMGTNEAICYSDAVSCVASAGPAFSKRGDLLILDDGVNHALRTGATLSRSTCLWFKHNDMEDLERVLKGAVKRYARSASTQRRFIVFEGLYKNSGDIAKLDEIVRLGAKYKVRLMADESLSWGVLGENGRGVTEHYNLPVSAIDVIIGSLAASLGSVGGFCVGNREVTDHQRLAGAGYCFSASAPPFLCATAKSALQRMTPKLLTTLRKRAQQLSEGVQRIRHFKVLSSAESPMLHAHLAEPGDASQAEQDAILDNIARECLERGVLVSRTVYMPDTAARTAATLRLHVTAAMSKSDVAHAVGVLQEAADAVIAGERSAAAPARGRGRQRATTTRRRKSTAAAAVSTPAQRSTSSRRRSARLSAKK